MPTVIDEYNGILIFQRVYVTQVYIPYGLIDISSPKYSTNIQVARIIKLKKLSNISLNQLNLAN